MRQLIIDDYNGLQGLIDLVEQAARERDDIHFRVVNTDTNSAQTRKPMGISMSITIKADKDDLTAQKEGLGNGESNDQLNQEVQELLVLKLKEGAETGSANA